MLRLSDLLTIKAALAHFVACGSVRHSKPDWEHAIEVENTIARMIEAEDRGEGLTPNIRCYDNREPPR